MTESYQVEYTDYQNKGSLTVDDGTINTSTSLKFPGRNASPYGKIIAENFLHLLENFASNAAPNAPVQGQLWFNTLENQLYINDGTQWGPASGLKRGAIPPEAGISLMGDLWVNTDTQQLFLFTGSAWTLVGPTFSSGSKSGTHAEEIIDSNDVAQIVISHYINNVRIAIISSTEFTPKSTINGFTVILKGITLNSEVGIYNGVAQTAKSLLAGAVQVPAASFLRNDVVNNVQEPFYVRNHLGLSIGNDAQTAISIDNTGAAVITHNTSGSNIDFRLNNGLSTSTVLRIDNSGKIGINNTNPQESLDVSGNAVVSGNIHTNSLIATNEITTGNIISSGNVLTNRITATEFLPSNSAVNIGSSSQKINRIYVNELSVSNLIATTVSGTLFSGTASRANELSSPITISLDGDVTSNVKLVGTISSGFNASITTSLNSDFIMSKDEVSSMQESDMFLISRNIAGLKRIKKSSIFSLIPQIPAGAIMPFAGATAPAGWLLCDGTEVSQASYPELFGVIQYTYGALSNLLGANTFRIPDLRGRFPLGLDSMFNNISVPTSTPGVNVITVDSPAGRVPLAEANMLGLGNADLPGNGSLGSPGSSTKIITVENLPDHDHDLQGDAGTQFYAINPVVGAPADTDAVVGIGGIDAGVAQLLPTTGTTVGALGTPIDVMNPFLGLNYIIYTGKVV